jgi:TonB family protein
VKAADPRTLGFEAEEKAFSRAALIALALELSALIGIGLSRGPWHLGAGQGTDVSNYIEAQVMDLPEDAHLVSQAGAPASPDEVLSKIVGQGKKPEPGAADSDEQNQTQNGPDLGATHGAVALYSPSPVIPSYLRDREINSSVVIEFLVTAAGQATPRLLSSSGNEELDAIALGTVKKWQFKPAETEHRPVDSKSRLRIVFQVY